MNTRSEKNLLLTENSLHELPTIGFIGTGNMGKTLIEAFMLAQAVPPCSIRITNRTLAKATALANLYPGMTCCESVSELAMHCQILFICVKPMEYKAVLEAIFPYVTVDTILVSITSPVMIEQLEQIVPCKVAKIIPSITQQSLSGISLCMFGSRLSQIEIKLLEHLFAQISIPVSIDESWCRIASDLTSCGPAFFACFLDAFIEASSELNTLPKPLAIRLASEMLLGTGRLLTRSGLTPTTLAAQVAVPGGITAKGLELIKKELRGLFPSLIRTTHTKFEEDVSSVKAHLSGIKIPRM